MTKLSRKWLVEIAEWKGWPISESFVDRLNFQLPTEFETLTGKAFDRKLFHFNIGYENELEYFPDDDVPFGRISGTLMFKGTTSIDIAFKWYDKSSNLLFKLEDDISNSAVEFHWINLPVDSWEISRIKEYKLIDIRDHNGFNSPFPILCYSKNIGTDISFNVKLKGTTDIPNLLNILAIAQNEWNSQSLVNGIYVQGIFHSVRFSHENESGQAVFPVNIGSASENIFNFLIDRLVESKIPIKEMEIENG